MKKRLFLIGLGTVGGLGSVLVITPPQFGSTKLLNTNNPVPLNPIPSPSNAPTPVLSSTPTITKNREDNLGSDGRNIRPKSTKTTLPKNTPKSTPKNTQTSKATTKPRSTPTPTAKSKQVSGTFTGNVANTQYDPVQVQITIVNNKIAKATALLYPTSSFRDQQINSQAIPYLVQETLAVQSANIQGIGGASYTSAGWQSSLASALSKAGL